MSAGERLPSLGRLVGAMLGARLDRAYARGTGHLGPDRERADDELWAWRGCLRCAGDGRTTVTGPRGSRIRVDGRPAQAAPVPVGGPLGWTHALLVPSLLLFWGRPGEDWRLGEVDGWSALAPGAVEVGLEHVDDDRRGTAQVDPATGRVLALDLPGTVAWRVTEIDDAPDVDRWPLRRWFAAVADEARLPR